MENNLGLEQLYKYSRKFPGPYEDRLRSTNAKEFKRDTSLDNKDLVDVERFELSQHGV